MEYPRPWLKIYEQYGVSFNNDYEAVSLYELLKKTAKEIPDKTAIIFYGRKISYGQLLALAERTASAFHQIGIRKGDRVAVMLPNCPDFAIAYYAILRLGAIVVNTNPMYMERELEHQLNDSGARFIVVLQDLYPRVKNIRSSTPLEKVFITSFLNGKPEQLDPEVYWFPELYATDREPAPEVEVDAREDIAVLQYTGGTTGVSKGAMLTHYNLYVNAMQTSLFFEASEEWREKKESILVVIPLFHVYGMTCGMNLALATGTAMILLPRFEINEFVKTLQEYRPTYFPGVPTIYHALRQHPEFLKDPLAAKVYSSGSAPLAVEIVQDYMKMFENTDSMFSEGYGLSEASPVTHSNPGKELTKPGSIGVPYPDTEAAIVDLETGTKFLPPGEIGELVIKGPQVMKGYWNRPEQTAQTLKNGWLYTGDIAKMDEDGYFYIVDRKKDIIIAGGFNIYPRDIEEVLYELPQVLEAVVVGIPDPYRGETVKAYLVLKEGQSLSEEEVIAYCKQKMAAYKVPKQIEFRKELPKTAVGKLLRRKLREEELAKMRAQ